MRRGSRIVVSFVVTVHACLVGTLCLPAGAGAQRGLPSLARTPDAVLRERFTDIAAVRVLGDGRVLVLDAGEQRLVVADFQSGRVVPIGRAGRGPGEYVRPTRLLALPADTTWLVDLGQNRLLLLVGADIVGVVPAFAGEAVDSGFSAASLRGVDARGVVYFTGRGLVSSEQGVVVADSVTLYATLRGGGTVAPVTRLAQASAQITVRNGAGSTGAMNVVRIPFVVGDEMIVEPEGTVAVVRRAPYRLEVARRGGAVLRGPELRVPSIAITAGDRAQYLATLPPAAATSAEGVPWPSHKPPFVTRTLVAGADGSRWVMRSGRAEDASVRYDIFDANARPVGRVEVASSLRVLWVGASSALVVRSEKDGLQSLERYRVGR